MLTDTDSLRAEPPRGRGGEAAASHPFRSCPPGIQPSRAALASSSCCCRRSARWVPPPSRKCSSRRPSATSPSPGSSRTCTSPATYKSGDGDESDTGKENLPRQALNGTFKQNRMTQSHVGRIIAESERSSSHLEGQIETCGLLLNQKTDSTTFTT